MIEGKRINESETEGMSKARRPYHWKLRNSWKLYIENIFNFIYLCHVGVGKTILLATAQ